MGLALGALPARAQVASNRATAYLQPTEAQDARAVWVNPAGLAATQEASVHLDLTIGTPGARGRLRQLTAGFESRGLSFGYQRDWFDSLTAHTYRLGLGGASGGLALGLAVAYYRGATASSGWDVGVRYAPRPQLILGGVVANLGQPVVRGLRQRATVALGATLAPFGPAVDLSATGRLTTADVVGYSVTARWHGPDHLPLGVLARVDTDGRWRRGAFAFGVSLGNQDAAGAVATTPGDVTAVEALSVWGVSARPAGRR